MNYSLFRLIFRQKKFPLFLLLSVIVLVLFLFAKQQFHPLVYADTDLLSRYDLLYGSEIGAWETNGKPAVDTSTPIPGDVTSADIPVIRFAVYDCFTDETCGRDSHTGSLSRSTFDSAISGIVSNLHAVPWIKMLPITKGTIGSVAAGSIFCPAQNNLSMNLSMEEDLMNEIHKVYTGPIIIESSNEAEYDCFQFWGFASAGAVGVSRVMGDMYNATMPALVKYSRDTLGFSQVVTVGYIGIGGGTGWGQTCTANSSFSYGYNCTYQSRWVNEFNTQIQANYATHSADPDYIPNVESIHNYCHSTDFGTNPFTFDDDICFAFFRNWITQSRSQLKTIWGSTIGNAIRFAMSEWEAGVCTNLSTNCWSGWSIPSEVQSYYSGWLGMLQGDGNTTGSGTRYWAANVFEIASNADSSPGGYYNIIHQDGSTPDWYETFKSISLNDTLAHPVGSSTSSGGSSGPNLYNNFPVGYYTYIMAGPHYQGNNALQFIMGNSGAENAGTFIPSNALHDDANITITRVSPADLLQTLPIIPFPWTQHINTAGDIYNFLAIAALNGMTIQKFDKPVTIIIPYDPLRLFGVNPTQLKIAQYNSSTKRWSLLTTPVIVNTQNHTLATTVNSFSYFTVGYPR